MKTIVNRDKLLDIIRENKEKHRAVFLQAIDGYRKEATQILESRIEDLKNRKKTSLYVNLPEPEDHTTGYDRIIRMVEMDERDSIELGEREFAQYVMDDWEWKQQWVDTVSNYVALAT